MRNGLLKKVAANLSDAACFGPQFLLRHFSRISSRPLPVMIPGVGRIHLRPGESDVSVVRQVFKEREYEMKKNGPIGTRIYKKYADILGAGRTPVIIDAGANIGASSLWFARQYPLANIIAVEPEPRNVAALRMNVCNERGIVVVAAAVGGRPGFVSTYTKVLGWGTTTTRSCAGIPVVTMAHAFGLVRNGQPFIAKIDIEGFEKDLFSRDFEWLKSVYAVFIEPHDWLMPGQMTSKTFQQAFAKCDFELFIKGEKLVYVRVD
jgi:FkbM family methyltransferase